ncbi:DUF1850 domain-containing protein [Alkalihalophilus lindianensis]|uniref:DUF1850 domain-containing protein n=1 Tax=Alkalihalophilus lindianensis TaxID=1630542 RepID=A0ABU3XAN9_9BACI|nr:DUF1850 domain-containing protein [Alkalihalophilus lindianensis]MDV2684970.1 DUF1850 domain-containing protein [Alkalihalophilus lindianensis]
MNRIIALTLILFFSLVACTHTSYTGHVQIQRTEEVIHSIPDINVGDQWTIKWIHSVEKTPWEETYEVSEDGSLRLVETVFYSFGAGVPHEKGSMTIEDGKVVTREIDQEIEAFRWIHSHNAEFAIYLNDEILFQTEDLPHHEPLELIIEKR